MAKISKNRNFKMVTGFIMTLVMILSLFAGIGAIFVNEDTSRVDASVLESDLKTFKIPKATGELGTANNPFVVLEVVPNENMATMGYLVSGQEPVDIDKLEAADAASFLADGTRPLTQKLVDDYKFMEWKNGDTPKKSEFANMIPETGSDEAFYTEGSVSYKIDQMTQQERGEYRQFGYYKLAGKDAEGHYKGNYKLGETVTEIEGLGEGYGYYPEVGVGVDGKNKSELSETELSELDYEYIKKLTGKEFSELVPGTDYVMDSNGDIYLRVAEGTGVYSDKIYDRNTFTVTFMSSDEDDAVVYEAGGKRYEFTVLAGDTLKSDQIPSATSIEGHDYEYWKVKGETSRFDFSAPITDDLILVPMYKGVTVHFVAVKNDGTPNETIDEIEVEYNSKLAKPDTDPELEGYTFKGWYKDEALGTAYEFGKKIKDETSVYAKFEINTYTVTFEPGSAGTNVTNMPRPNPQEVQYKQKVTEPANPKWEKHRFKEWHDSDGNKYDFDSEVTDNIVLTAVWDNEFTVSFNANGGTGAPEAQQVVAGGYAEEPTTRPTWGDLTFGGWFEEGSDTAFDFAHTKINANVELFAKWFCTVEFDSNGGNNVTPKTVQIEYNKTIAESGKTPADPEWDTAHEFLEWHIGSEDGAEINFDTYKVTTNITLVAKWDLKGYTVKFELRGGSYTGDQKDLEQLIPAGEKVTALNNSRLSKDNTANTVAHWKVGSIDGPDYDFNQPVNADLTLYASWNITVTFNANATGNRVGWNTGGNTWRKTREVTVEEGHTVDPYATNPTNGAQVFTGWVTSSTGGFDSYFDFNTAITENTVLYAKWTTKHIVIFDANGGTPEYQYKERKNNNRVDKPSDPTREGYQFAGWKYNGRDYTFRSQGDSDDNSNTADITVTASWKRVRTYTVYDSTNPDSEYASSYSELDDYVLFRKAEPADFENLDVAIYEVKSDRGWRYFSNQDIHAYYICSNTSSPLVATVDNATLHGTCRIVQFKYCTERPTGQPTNPDYDEYYYVVDTSHIYNDYNSFRRAYGLSNSYSKQDYYWLTYSPKTVEVVTQEASLDDIGNDEVVSYASGSATVTELIGTRSTSKGSGGAGGVIDTSLYTLNHEIDISTGALPEYVDEEDGTKGGNKNFVRYVIRQRKVAEARYTYKMVEVEAGKEATEGKYEWVGLNFENNQKVKDAKEQEYLNYYVDHGLTLMTTEQKEEKDALLDAGTSPYNKILDYQIVKVYDYYVLELKNTDLFKKNALGLAYLNGDVLQSKDITAYNFIGWFKDKYGVNPFTNEGITSDVTLYAKWEAVLEGKPSCSIYFYTGLPDGTEVTGMPGTINNINNGAMICEPESVPITEGKIFTGWYDEEGNKFKFEETKITSQITKLTAHWADLGSDRFSFRFDSNIGSLSGVHIKDGSWPIDIDAAVALNGMKVKDDGTFEAIGESRPVLIKNADATESDYEFAGWYLDSECREKFSFSNAQPTLEKLKEAGIRNIVLYARWVRKDSLPNYTVTFMTNEPATSKTTATGLDNYISSGNSVLIQHGKKVTTVKNSRTIKDVQEIKLSLKGNVEDKIDKYVVEVITVTPEDLKLTANLGLIDRANLIVLSEAYDTELINTWKKEVSGLGALRNTDRFPKTSYGLTSTSFVDNDLDWASTLRVLSRITGMRKKTDNTVETVATCPVLYDYKIFNSVTSSSTVRKNLTTALTFSDGNGSETGYGYNSNVYKLYLMTQQVNPATAFNAYIRNNPSVSGSINNIGTLSGGGSISGTDTGSYWNKYTLVPWKEIAKADYGADLKNALSLIGFKDNYELDPGTSKISNRMLLYNESSENGFAKDFNRIILNVHPEMADVFGTAAETREYTVSEAIYYLLKSKTQYDNYSHNLRVLDIEPGNQSKSNEYWFWYISRYVPNYTGNTTVRTMSTAEFICNIDDLNSQYDVLYMGAATGVTAFDKSADGSINFTPDSDTFVPNVPMQSYYTSTNSSGSGAVAKDYKLINAVKGMKVNGTYYVIKDVKEVTDSNEYEFSSVPVTGWNDCTAVLSTKNLNTSSADFDFDVDQLPATIKDKVTVSINRSALGNSYTNPCYGLKKNNGGNSFNNFIYFDEDIKVNINGVSFDVIGEAKSDSAIKYFYTNDGYNWYNPGYKLSIQIYYHRKPGTSTTRKVYIVEQKSSGTVADTGRILIPGSTTTIGGNALFYSHVGDTTTGGDGRANYGIVSPSSGTGSEFTTKMYSGNDITFKKYKEIAKFLEAGYPIIISKDLFLAPESNKINTALVDTSSWIYKLLDELTDTVTGSPYFWYREDDSSHDSSFRQALSNKVFHLIVDSTPPEYKDLTNPDNAGVSEEEIYINGRAPYNNRTMEFSIRIDAEESGRSYMLRMFTDTNADGRYDIENEMLDSVQIKDLTAGRSGIASSMILQSGHTYQVLRTLTEDYTGIIPWKLQVLEVDASKKPTGVYDDKIGMAAIKVDEDKKEKLYVLQITSEINANTSSGNKQYYTNVFFPTDQEIKAANPTHQATGVSFSGLTAGYNDANKVDVRSDAWNSNTRKNMDEFYKYTSNLKEFEVHFLRVSIDKRSGTDRRASLKEIADNPGTKIGETLKWDGSAYVKDKDIYWSDINMLILGYADCFNDITDTESLELIKDFIESGKTTLFTHDTTSPVNRERPTSESYYNRWGYKINEYFRDFLGMDRYGVMQHAHQKATAAHVGATAAAALGSGKDFTDIDIAHANDYKLAYDVPFAPNKTMDLFNGSNVRDGNLEQYSGTMLIQGLNNRNVNTGTNYEMTKVTQNNSGQIVVYPYTIGKESDQYSISVGLTHSQYYQLNMEDDEIVVWYSVYEEGRGFQKLVNDGSNNYYIYNKGNITYSGVGHQANMTDDEYKLFVNTMIAAYNSRVRATEPIIKNSDKSSDSANGKDYIYVDFDATVSEVNSTVPVGGDIEKKTAPDGTVYYTKKVEFELRNYSIIMNKFMTVHFYPVVYDKDVLVDGKPKKVVLYDHPIPLVVKKSDDDNNPNNDETASLCSADWSEDQIRALMGRAPTAGLTTFADMAFAYKMPDGKVGKTESERAKENREIIGVGKGSVYEVESLEQYYVEIPITNSYYKNVLHLPDRYSYYPDDSSFTSGSKTYLYSKGNSYGVADSAADYDKNCFGIDLQNSFEVEIQVVMRFGRDETRNMPYVGTKGIVFLRRGIFTLD